MTPAFVFVDQRVSSVYEDYDRDLVRHIIGVQYVRVIRIYIQGNIIVHGLVTERRLGEGMNVIIDV